ncbi:MAG: hypothetical protein HY812_11435 [Planctomycetes bacterium]|nr:hypothetical protein [Planctomycetota bacterium]
MARVADDPFPTYGLDDDLLEAARRDGRSRVRVARPEGAMVVLGAGSRPERELYLDACARDGVPILRRRGGGCAVVLDPGNVLVAAVAVGLPSCHRRCHFDALSAWLVSALALLGLPGVEPAGISDLALRERKVGGACLYRRKDLLYYAASLLVSPDVERASRYLRHPPREPAYRRGRPHAEFMGSLAEHAHGQGAGALADPERFAAGLSKALGPLPLGERQAN